MACAAERRREAPPNPRMQPTSARARGAARALTSEGGQRNEGLCWRYALSLQLRRISLGGHPHIVIQ
jgi:hypothetical protein